MPALPPNRSRRRWAMAGAVAALGLVVTTVPRSDATFPRDETAQRAATVTHRAAAKADPTSPADTIRLTQANLKSGQPTGHFDSDVGTVLANQPDFITYNEVPFRPDSVLAPPPGYALWRTPGRYTGETPVAWRTDRWSMVAEGTTMLSNKKGRLPWQHVDWGIRYANWVTLSNVDGRTISVVSAHLTPVISITEGLQAREIQRLGALVGTLSASGPVLVGGDFNMNYDTPQYLGGLFQQFNLVPSYDALAAHFPTGDHYGATIDYVMLHQDLTTVPLAFTDQYAQEIYSDHDAVTVDLTWTAPPTTATYEITPGTVVGDPTGQTGSPRAVLRTMLQAVNHAPAGSAVHLVTRGLTAPAMSAALDRAIDRHVRVQIILRSRTLGTATRHFMARLGENPARRSFAIQCSGSCRKLALQRETAATELLISTVDTTPSVRIISDHAITLHANKVLNIGKVTTRKAAYDRAFRRFFLLAGRPI